MHTFRTVARATHHCCWICHSICYMTKLYFHRTMCSCACVIWHRTQWSCLVPTNALNAFHRRRTHALPPSDRVSTQTHTHFPRLACVAITRRRCRRAHVNEYAVCWCLFGRAAPHYIYKQSARARSCPLTIGAGGR